MAQIITPQHIYIYIYIHTHIVKKRHKCGMNLWDGRNLLVPTPPRKEGERGERDTGKGRGDYIGACDPEAPPTPPQISKWLKREICQEPHIQGKHTNNNRAKYGQNRLKKKGQMDTFRPFLVLVFALLVWGLKLPRKDSSIRGDQEVP